MEQIRFSDPELFVGQAIDEYLNWHDAEFCGMNVVMDEQFCRIELLIKLHDEVKGEYEFRFIGVRRSNLHIPCADFSDSSFVENDGMICTQLETLYDERFLIESAEIEIAPGDRSRYASGEGYGKVL